MAFSGRGRLVYRRGERQGLLGVMGVVGRPGAVFDRVVSDGVRVDGVLGFDGRQIGGRRNDGRQADVRALGRVVVREGRFDGVSAGRTGRRRRDRERLQLQRGVERARGSRLGRFGEGGAEGRQHAARLRRQGGHGGRQRGRHWSGSGLERGQGGVERGRRPQAVFVQAGASRRVGGRSIGKHGGGRTAKRWPRPLLGVMVGWKSAGRGSGGGGGGRQVQEGGGRADGRSGRLDRRGRRGS